MSIFPPAVSILDLCAVSQGSTAATALHNSARLAQTAERLGFGRIWLAEHHNMPGIASAATSVVIGHVASQTSTIRVGAGGIMLPNHSPLVVAEQFGTLESLYPGRIDLGVGRAPGGDPAAARALRRDPMAAGEHFPQDVIELLGYFETPAARRPVEAFPGVGLNVPVWLLGSSTYSAQLAAQLGLPFAFAAHFAPGDMEHALHIYRRNFAPSKYLTDPYAMVAVNVIAAEDDAQARHIFSSQQQAFLNLRRGRPGMLPPPVDDIRSVSNQAELAMLQQSLAQSYVGDPETVITGLERLMTQIDVDEIMMCGHFYSLEDRLRSLELMARVLGLRSTLSAA